MYTFVSVVLTIGAACAADLAELPQSSAFDSGTLATASLCEALEVDDACLAERSHSLSLMQIRGAPLRIDEAAQVKAIVQRRPAKVAPQTDLPEFMFLQESVPGNWGDVIDAGTGPGSLGWLVSCPVNTLTAVTANESAVRWTLQNTEDFLDKKLDKVLAGNWRDPKFLQGRQFDVVVADWLLGSVEFFAPHFQVGLVRRLSALVKPGGWLLLTGREPDHLKASAPNASTVGARLLLDIDALRDAATILGHRHPYRELPQWWVEEELATLGFHIHKRKTFELTLADGGYMFSQLEWAGDEIKRVSDERLRAALEDRKQALHRHALQTQSEWQQQSFGNTYALVARLL